jgi:hypothetical protein
MKKKTSACFYKIMDIWWIFMWMRTQSKPRQYRRQKCELLTFVNTLDKQDADIEMCERLRNVGFQV